MFGAERALQAAVATLPAPVKALTVQVVTLPDEERAHAIGKLYENERTRFFAELLIDLVQNPPACAMLVAAILESL
jgi:hypothetical protein